MVLYFSGTGNSQYIAIHIADKAEDGEAVSINPYLKTGKKGAFQSQTPWVFVAPTYAWRMPKVLEQWIGDSDFQGCKDVYFILTCAGGCGNAAAYAEKLCARKGLRFRGLAQVEMPENYLAMFPTPKEAECQAIIKRAQPKIAALAEQIQAGETFDKVQVSQKGKIQSGIVNAAFYTWGVRDKGFSVLDTCISCGKCAYRCPLDNIRMEHGKPAWKGNCTHCMACIGGCPTEAIEYKLKSQGQHRHYIMNDTVCWKNYGEAQ